MLLVGKRRVIKIALIDQIYRESQHKLLFQVGFMIITIFVPVFYITASLFTKKLGLSLSSSYALQGKYRGSDKQLVSGYKFIFSTHRVKCYLKIVRP